MLRTATGLASGSATYRYHADGSRREKTAQGATTQFYYMGGLGYLDEEDTQFAADQEIAEYDGTTLRMPTVIDEYTRECPAIKVARRLNRQDVLDVLGDRIVARSVPDHIRADNGGQFGAKAVRQWLERIGAKTLYIEPGSPLENGYNESSNGRLQGEFFKVKPFNNLMEAKIVIEMWHRHYNTVRPHPSLGYKPPAPIAFLPANMASATGRLQPAPPSAERNLLVT